MSDRKRPRAAAGVLIATLLAFVPIVMTGSALGDTPVFSNVPADITTEATGPGGAVVDYVAPTATDPVNNSDLLVSCTPESGLTLAITTTAVNCYATGTDGTPYTTSFNVTVQDKAPPEISGVPADITKEATSSSGAVVPYTDPTASDVVDGPLTPTCAPASESIFAIGETTVTCSATDSHGNTGSATFKVTVRDTTAPTISGVPADITREASGASGITVSYTNPTATDAVDGPRPVSCAPASGSTFPLGDTTVTCTSADNRGNTASASFKVTVQDKTAPVISGVPTDISVNASSPSGAIVTFTNPTATDAVDGTRPVSCAPISGATFALGQTTVDCTATDSHGNSSSASFKVTVQDTMPPVISGVPADITREASGASGTTVSYTNPTATDAVDGPRPVSCAPASGSTFPLGDTTVTCTSADSRGNTASASFKVTVQDKTAPVISGVPTDITREATGASGAAVNYTNPTATDLVDGTRPVSCLPASGSTFPLGDTTVTCTSADSRGNTASDGFKVTVQDTTPPGISLTSTPNNPTNQTTASFTFSSTDLTATFQCKLDSAVYSPCSSPTATGVLNEGSHTFLVKAVDPSGNASPASYTWKINTHAPSFSNIPGNITQEATGPGGAIVNYTPPTATDPDTHLPVTVTCTPLSGSAFAITTTTVSCTAQAGNGSWGDADFNVTVRDTTAPVISGVPADFTREASGPGGVVATYTNPTVSDLVDGARPVSCTPPSGSTFTLGQTTVNCLATDSHGNTSSASFKVTVQDTTAPVLSGVPADLTGVEATSYSGAPVSYATPTATDLVDGPLTPTCTPASGSTFPLGQTTVTCSAVDTHGNPTSASFKVTVQDKTAPAIVDPSDVTAEATGPGGATVNYSKPTATDLADPSPAVACVPAPGSIFVLGDTTVTCTATDASGNSSPPKSFKLTVQDKTPPAIAGTPAQIGATATSSSGAAVSYTNPTATDLVDGARPVSCTPTSGSTFPLGSTTVTCSAADLHGNQASTSFAVIVSAPAPPPVATPSLVVPLSLKAEATSRAGAVVNFDVSSGDNPAPTITCKPSSGSIFPLGTTKVACTALSAGAGAQVAKTFTVIVRDTTAPTFAGKLPNIVKKVSGKKPIKVAFKQPVTTDAVDGNVASVCSPRSGSKFKFGKTTVTCKATDAHQNARKISFSVRVTALPKRALIAPENGASLSSPPLLKWTAIAKADYYNVQVFRNGHKVLSTWPRASSFRLTRGWKFEGAKQRLAPGTYTWFVWPGFGSLAAVNYGRLIGQGSFTIVR
jgi:hypothetical protein